MNTLYQSIRLSMVTKVVAYPNWYVFSHADFIDLGYKHLIDDGFKVLVKKGILRYLGKGLYDRPNYSNLLGKEVGPDINEVVEALGRKYSWIIHPSDNTCLNRLGLSTQVPCRYVFNSSGPTREIKIRNSVISFKHMRKIDQGVRSEEGVLIIHSIRALGKERINTDVIHRIKHSKLKNFDHLIDEFKSHPKWIREIIERIVYEPVTVCS